MHRVLDRARTCVRQDNRNVPALRSCAADLKALQKDLQRARLGEGAAFAEVTQRIKAWFGPYEARVRRAQTYLEEMLASLALESNGPILIEDDPDPKAQSPDAQPYIHDNIPTRPKIKSLDRDRLDLEALRPYLTDYALTVAAKRHLLAQGPGTLRGAEYGLKVLD